MSCFVIDRTHFHNEAVVPHVCIAVSDVQLTQEHWEEYAMAFRALYQEAETQNLHFSLCFDCRLSVIPLTYVAKKAALLGEMRNITGRRLISSTIIVSHPTVRKMLQGLFDVMYNAVRPQLICNKMADAQDFMRSETATYRRRQRSLALLSSCRKSRG